MCDAMGIGNCSAFGRLHGGNGLPPSGSALLPRSGDTLIALSASTSRHGRPGHDDGWPDLPRDSRLTPQEIRNAHHH